MTVRQPPLVNVCWAVTSFSATLPAVEHPAVDDPAASYAMDEQQESQQELWIRRAIPLTRLATAATRRQFQSAPVVLGYDEAAEQLVLVYGREALANLDRGEEVDQQTLVLRYNGQRDELNDLLAVCRELKCHCDYDERGGEPWAIPAAAARRRLDMGQPAPSTSARRGRRSRRAGENEAN